jgi:hypothetical protein
VSSSGSRVEIAHPGVVEWYENSPAGLEQGFTIARRPPGSGDMRLALDVQGASADLGEDGVVLTAANGRRLAYRGLAAVDGTGRKLPAHFALAATTRVELAIDDRSAAYPMEIDPILGEAVLSSDQTGAGFGVSVAGAGDVNGDGYDDVIVGAQYFAGRGEAFVFTGSATGVASGGPANAALRIDEGVPNGRLGVSVARAGDINGDGASDLIVGDPADKFPNQPQIGRAIVALPEPARSSALAGGVVLLAALARRRERAIG